jgi:hypothetical protein
LLLINVLILITAVLKPAIEQGFTAKAVQGAFRRTGLYPCDQNAIDASQLTGDVGTIVQAGDVDIPLHMECTDDTESCKNTIINLISKKIGSDLFKKIIISICNR